VATAKKSRPARPPAVARKAPARKAPARKAPAPKPAAKKPVPAKAAPPATLAVVPAVMVEKTKKAKLVRDSFTIPKVEYAVLQSLKDRAARLGRPAKKSEVLRAGVTLLAGLGDAAFGAALAAVPTIKTGRPAKD
jgi:hypothetical protein